MREVCGTVTGAALVLGKPVVQPVVSDRHCERHLARVEEVARVPVRERADGVQLGEGALELMCASYLSAWKMARVSLPVDREEYREYLRKAVAADMDM